MSFSNQENSSQTAPDLISSNKDYANVPAFSFGSSKARKRFSWEKNLSMKKVENNVEMNSSQKLPISGELQKIMDHYGIDPNSVEAQSLASSQNEGLGLKHRHLSTNEKDHPKILKSPPSFDKHSEHNQRLAIVGIKISSILSDIIFCHPFVVLRRQCQVNGTAKKFHLNPFTSFNVLLNLQSAQGLFCLWKGLGSQFWLMAFTIGSESLIHEFSHGSLPREVPSDKSISSLGPHLALKTLVAVIASPIFSVHLVESVQSDMTSETPSVFSCLSDAFHRVFRIGNMWSPRLLPFYKLLIPTVSFHLFRYIISSSLQRIIKLSIRWIDKRYHERRTARIIRSSPTSTTWNAGGDPKSLLQSSSSPPAAPPSLVEIYYPDLISSFTADFVTDILLYPFETTLNRIHIQGTRTIIDNTDTGRGFCSVGSRYEGFCECFSSIKEVEGLSGLYRGFGALILQHCFKYATVRFIHLTLEFFSA